MKRQRSLPAVLLFVLLAVLAAIAAAAEPASSTGAVLPCGTGTAVAQPAAPAWDPANLQCSEETAALIPAPSPMAAPPCPLPCNPGNPHSCTPPSKCRSVGGCLICWPPG